MPRKLLKTHVAYTLIAGLLYFFTAVAVPSPSHAGNGGLSGPSFGNSLGSGSSEEFLPVEQAYMLTPRIENGEIHLHWEIAPGYYLYQDKFGFTALGDGESQKLQTQFEPGKRIFDEYFNKELTVYYNETDVVLPLPEEEPFTLRITSQGCADAGLCYPPRTQTLLVDPAARTIIEPAPDAGGINAGGAADVPPSFDGTPDPVEPAITLPEAPFLPWVLLAALLGGVILNLMPCVFPVLSLKALSFASSHLSRHKQHVHGWAYSAGIISCFLLAAAVMLAARQAGEIVGWGFQLQSPVFVAFMAYLFFAMALSLVGVFQLGTRLMGVGQSLTGGHGLRASFFTGVLAALVASPCTAPLMATALGFAMTQPAAIALLVFAALGFGMALPFLILSYSPGLARRLPAPGPWMETLKQLLAFPLLLTCVWLLWVLGRQLNSDAVIVVLMGATALAFGCWVWQKQPDSAGTRLFSRSLAAAALAVALVLALRVEVVARPDSGQWQPYTAGRLAELRNQQEPVFINLTADWCITCLANDRAALDTEAVQSTAADLGVTMLKGDWTNENPEITALLHQYGRSGVPLYLMYPRGPGNAEVLPQILTRQSVINALERGAGGASPAGGSPASE